MLKAFSIKDEKAKVYSPPFFVPSTVVAIRSVLEAASDEKSNLYKFPKEFGLYQIGVFNEDNGDLAKVEPINLGTIADLVGQKEYP